MKRFSSLCVATLFAFAATGARAGGVECAIRESLESKNLLGVPIEAYHHQFTIKPVEATEVAKSTHTVSGTIVHHNKGVKDDQIAYRITKEKGRIKDVSLRLNDGKWEALSPQMMSALGAYLTGKPMSTKEQDAATDAIYNAGRGTWRNAVKCLIARIGVLHC